MPLRLIERRTEIDLEIASTTSLRSRSGVGMRTFIRSAVFAIVAATIPTFTQLALAQSVPTNPAEQPLQSPLATADGELPELRLARPLSRNEEIALRPMDQFKECERCPEMVVVPAGQFVMGAAEDETGSTRDERPQHTVSFAQPFGVGRFPVTLAEWDACVAARGCSYRPSDRGWGRGTQPVIDILWNDATEYVDWLSRTTGKTYRLLSESEREYVARAGTTTAYWWGDSFEPTQANSAASDRILFSTSISYSPQPIVKGRTAPAQSFAPNPWGLYQVHGNVYDWVEDCWHANYDGAPADGSAWMIANCDAHVLRGGAFSRNMQTARSAARLWFGSANRIIYMSVRVARTLGR
jgi:formylglycine-generating enzyme required for sulfatase activity